MNNIQMNVPMARATIEDKKTNTRRAIRLAKGFKHDCSITKDGVVTSVFSNGIKSVKIKAKYKIDEVIWVREPAKVTNHFNVVNEITIQYLADGEREQISIPRRFLDEHNSFAHVKWIEKYQGIPNGCIKEMARIFLKVTDVRVERLQDISYENIMDEGCDLDITTLYDGRSNQAENIEYNLMKWWKTLWNSTAPKDYKWEDNPSVFVYEFKRVENDS